MCYGANDIDSRVELWNSLRRLSCDGDTPWMIQGDFNALMNDEERLGGADLDDRHRAEMRECIIEAELTEMRTTGSFYTWTNNQAASERRGGWIGFSLI